MIRTLIASLTLAGSLAALPALAGELAPVPSTLMNRAGVVCIKVATNGAVRDAFVIKSTGDGRADADMIDWVRKLNWPAAKGKDGARNKWVPVPVAMGNAAVPEIPDSCAPPRAPY